ncbi:hypothetical protein IW262DRAFT_1292226 [Armillaria fumosa]|nr:hypothetical protein IW262DRAFT_1292226 [Armillaria fumosa]
MLQFESSFQPEITACPTLGFASGEEIPRAQSGLPHIADVQCGDTRTSVNPDESWNPNRDAIAGRDGGTCVILETGIVEYLDGFAHRCRTVRWARRIDERVQYKVGIDVKDAMFINREIHPKTLIRETCAFLYYVPNACMTMEDLDEDSQSLLNSSNSWQYPINVTDGELSSTSIEKLASHLVSWLWRANDVTMEEDGVDDTERSFARSSDLTNGRRWKGISGVSSRHSTCKDISHEQNSYNNSLSPQKTRVWTQGPMTSWGIRAVTLFQDSAVGRAETLLRQS